MLKNKIRNLSIAFCSLAVLIACSAVSGQKVAEASRASATDSELEEEIATLMKQAKDQRRPSLTYNPILAKVARERAYDMARRGYFAHVTPDGVGPNYLLAKAGYTLGKGYSKGKSANNVEAIACGGATAALTWMDWMNSKPHRTQILGLKSFYAEQTEYGVGHAFVANSPYGHYWVVTTAKPNPVANSSQKTTGR